MTERRHIQSFMDLEPGDKVIDIDSHKVMEFYEYNGSFYLSTEDSLYPLSQFLEEDFERYEGEKEPGEIDYRY